MSRSFSALIVPSYLTIINTFLLSPVGQCNRPVFRSSHQSGLNHHYNWRLIAQRIVIV